MKWKAQPYSALSNTWLALNKMFIFDNPDHAWAYIFAKIPSHLSGWRYNIHRDNVLPYNQEFDMFYHLNTHIDSIHFAALLCYWETDGFKELQGERVLPVTMVFEEIYREKKTKQNLETKELKSKFLDSLNITIEQETIQRSMSRSDSNSGPLSMEFEDHCVEVQQSVVHSKSKKRTKRLRGAFATKKPYKPSFETSTEHTGFISAETLTQEIRKVREQVREDMRQEIREETREEVRAEMRQEMREEMRQELA